MITSLKQHRTWHQIVFLVVVATVVTFFFLPFTNWWQAPALGWGAAAFAYNILVWFAIGSLDAAGTAAIAVKEEPNSKTRSILLNGSTVAAFITVLLLLIDTSNEHGTRKILLAGSALVAVFASWFLVHTLFTLRYAALYYQGKPGGISFNQEEQPTYWDFAYMSFSLGMTYQVSDTNISQPEIRKAALIQSFYAFLFGTSITATTINFVFSLL